MKTYLYPYAIAAPIPQYFLKTLLAFLLATFAISYSFADNGLVWKNATLQSGTAGRDGAIYRFTQVNNSMDALVTIKGRSSSLVTLANMDVTTTGLDKAWQPQVNYNNGKANAAADWWMEFEISFVNKSSNIPAIVSSFDITALDVDGNGDKIREYVTFYGLRSFMLESGSLLRALDIFELLGNSNTLTGKRFDGPTLNLVNIDTSGSSVMATSQYQSTNKFRVRTGGVASGANGSANRMYTLHFKGFAYSSPLEFTLPLVMTSFNAALQNKKVVLQWTTGPEKELSHFIIERSLNGTDYSEIGLMFPSGKNAAKNEYSYSDPIKIINNGMLYYRLRMEDEYGRYQYSSIRLVRMDTEISSVVRVQAYPNPVTREVRITVPAKWQSKQVSYELYNINGVLVDRFLSNSASQTEVMNMQSKAPGIYVVKAATESESASQTIVKK